MSFTASSVSPGVPEAAARSMNGQPFGNPLGSIRKGANSSNPGHPPGSTEEYARPLAGPWDSPRWLGRPRTSEKSRYNF